ncbi:MAG: ABC transporter substrate-binding protein [Hyphomicrobiaceae bacterium]|jgi:multiple sugar transport system substrate-binding protein
MTKLGADSENTRQARLGSTSRRTFLKATAGAAIGSTLAAPFVKAQSGTTLRFLNNETSASSQAALRAACSEYESKFGVKVVIDSTPISGAYAKTMAAINSGQPYDLATQGFIAHILQYAIGGHLHPLTDLVSKYSWGQMGAWKYQGENWFYPYDYNLVTVFYRKDLYAERGLKVPETWAQFAENCRALTVSQGGNIERGGCVLPIASDSATNWASFGNLFAEGGTIYDQNWNVALDQGDIGDKTRRFLDLYDELYKTMPPGMNTVSYAELMSLFVTGKVAHTVYSGRVVEALEARNPELADKYGVFASPDSTGKQKALSYAFDGFIVFKTKQSEEAVKFLKWFIDEHYINWLHSAWMNFQPARLDIYDDPRWKKHPMIQKHWGTMMQLKSYIEDKSMKLSSVDLAGPSLDLRPCKVFEANILPEMLQNKVLKGMSSADSVKLAADRVRKLS